MLDDRRSKKVLPARGFLIHMTHYDPVWYARKSRERPFDLRVATDVVEAMAEADMNMLVIDVADGVVFKSHPELKRRYSVPMATLRKLVQRARKAGLEVVPKLNFAQSSSQYHNEWFRPHNGVRQRRVLEAGLRAGRRADRRVQAGALLPRRHGRGHGPLARGSTRRPSRAGEGVEARGLQAVMWKDREVICPASGRRRVRSPAPPRSRCPPASSRCPGATARPTRRLVRRLRRKGFEVWGAPGGQPELVREWRDALLKYGATGILLTAWRPCRPGNRKHFLDLIRTCGPLCKEG